MVLILGEGNSELPKTPTLYQLMKDAPEEVPDASFAVRLFLPSKAPNYSFITEHDFRVNIHRSTPLYGLVSDNLHQWVKQGVAILILPNRSAMGGLFSLGLDENCVAQWDEQPWGYGIALTSQPPTAASKTTRKGRANN